MPGRKGGRRAALRGRFIPKVQYEPQFRRLVEDVLQRMGGVDTGAPGCPAEAAALSVAPEPH